MKAAHAGEWMRTRMCVRLASQSDSESGGPASRPGRDAARRRAGWDEAGPTRPWTASTEPADASSGRQLAAGQHFLRRRGRHALTGREGHRRPWRTWSRSCWRGGSTWSGRGACCPSPSRRRSSSAAWSPRRGAMPPHALLLPVASRLALRPRAVQYASRRSSGLVQV